MDIEEYCLSENVLVDIEELCLSENVLVDIEEYCLSENVQVDIEGLSFLCTSLANLLFCPGKEVWVRHLIEAMLKLDHMMFCN